MIRDLIYQYYTPTEAIVSYNNRYTYICRVVVFNIPWYEPKHSFKSEFRILISYSDVAIENKDTVEVALCGQCHEKQNEMKKIYVKSILFIWVHEKIGKLC